MNCADFVETLCSEILVTFVDRHCFLRFSKSSQSMKEMATTSFQDVQCVDIAVVLIT